MANMLTMQPSVDAFYGMRWIAPFAASERTDGQFARHGAHPRDISESPPHEFIFDGRVFRQQGFERGPLRYDPFSQQRISRQPQLLELAIFGFALNAIYGFGLRLLPGLIGLGSPKSGPIESAFWLHNSSVVALIAGSQIPWANTLGTAAIAVAAVVYVLGMRGFRSSRLRRLAKGENILRPEIGERFLRRYVQLAFVWLLVSLTMLAIGGVHSAWHAKSDSHQFIGAARHGLTVEENRK